MRAKIYIIPSSQIIFAFVAHFFLSFFLSSFLPILLIVST